MKYLKYFEEASAYEAYKNGSDYITPNVSYIVETDKVKYMGGDIVIMTSESNPEVMKVCYNQGWAASPYEMYASEAARVTSIGTAFQGLGKGSSSDYGYGGYFSGSGDYSSSFISFDEFKYFTGVTAIENGAFEDSNIVSIIIPDSVTTIGSAAFSGCLGLVEITIPNSVTFIGYGAFEDCSGLTELIIGSGVTTISSAAFEGCSGLVEITIPNSVTTIHSSVFENCSGLTSITIGSGVTDIRERAFRNCSSLTSIICFASTAPTIDYGTFYNVSTGGILSVPSGSDYSSWLSTNSYYLGYYNWTRL
jgi:hypothetical protein